MPKIVEYDAPALGLHPTETGINATAAAARRVGAEYSEIAAAKMTLGHAIGSAIRETGDTAVKYVEHQEISHGAAQFAQIQADMTDKWNETVKNADPNDTTVAAKFNEKVLQPQLEQFSGAFFTEGGQKWAESHIDSLRNHIFTKASADMSTLAADAVTVNIRKMTNAWTNAARNDPTSTEYLVGTADSSIKGVVSSSPNLKGTAAAKVQSEIAQEVKEKIVKAGALGTIEKAADPEAAAKSFSERWPDYINAQEVDQFAKAARYYKRINESETRANRTTADYEAKKDFNDKVNQLELSTAPKNAGDPPQLPADYWQKLRDLGQHSGAALEPGRLKTMVTNGEVITERLDKPEPLKRVSHATTMDLLTRIRATDQTKLPDTNAIYDAYQQGKLSNADFNFLTREFTNLRSPQGEALGRDRSEFFKRYAATIDGAKDLLTPGHSPLGQQKMYEAEMDARRREEDLRKKGLDPHLLYDPGSEYFFGKPNAIGKYRVSLQDATNYQAALDKGGNIGGPNKTVTGVEVINQPPGAKTFVPPNNWQWSQSRQQYRDPSGVLYDVTGKKVIDVPTSR